MYVSVHTECLAGYPDQQGQVVYILLSADIKTLVVTSTVVRCNFKDEWDVGHFKTQLQHSATS